MSDKDINDEDNLSLGEQLNHEMTGCPCGCDGIAQLHDDRSYGWWECPAAGTILMRTSVKTAQDVSRLAEIVFQGETCMSRNFPYYHN